MNKQTNGMSQGDQATISAYSRPELTISLYIPRMFLRTLTSDKHLSGEHSHGPGRSDFTTAVDIPGSSSQTLVR